MSDKLVIDVSGLTKRFGDKVVVKNLSLKVREGEIYGFLGPNGSGKTTSIRMICGLLTPDGGSGTCLGFDVLRESAAIKREVGYMTQKFSLWDDLTIRENLDFVARMFGMKNRRAVVDEALGDLGLTGRQDQLAGTLSGGWKQRMALAACLLHNPKLLLLDEPTAGVDPKARREFWEEIHRLSAKGMTVLVSTHYMDEAERCHRLAYIAYGELLVTGTADEVVAGQKLSTWEIRGTSRGGSTDGAAEIAGLAGELQALPGVEQVASFGNAMHVSGTDKAQLQSTLENFIKDKDLAMTSVPPTLEDAFIHLMRGSADQYKGKSA